MIEILIWVAFVYVALLVYLAIGLSVVLVFDKVCEPGSGKALILAWFLWPLALIQIIIALMDLKTSIDIIKNEIKKIDGEGKK